MPVIPIGLNLPDQQPVAPLGQKLQNVIVNESGVSVRPGHVTVMDTETSAKIDGIYWWAEQDRVIVVSNGNSYSLNLSGTTTSYLQLEDASYLLLEDGGRLILDTPAAKTDVTGATDLVVGNRVTWANYGDILYAANGAKIFELHPSAHQVAAAGHLWTAKLNHTSAADNGPESVATATYWTDNGVGTGTAWAAGNRYGNGKMEALEDASAPVTVSFITMVDNYLMALNDGTQLVYFSVVDEPWNWDSDFVSAEQLPDNANSMISRGDEVFVGGTRSIEILVDDGTTPWIPNGYGAIEHGVLAPHSLVNCAGMICWLDEFKRVVRLDGKTAVSLNPQLDTFVRRIPTVTDAIFDYMVIEGLQWLICQFPSSQVTVAVNLQSGIWSEWYSTVGGNQQRWRAAVIAAAPSWDMVIIGDTTNGIVSQISTDYSTENGTEIEACIRTPRMMAGRVTVVPELSMALTRVSVATDGVETDFEIKWRDDGKEWYTARTISLADQGKTDYVKHIYRLGAYRSYRQYEISGTWWPYAIQQVTSA